MKATLDWEFLSGTLFGSEEGAFGLAHLGGYSAEYKICGHGPPLVLVPGLAGGMELLGPLASILARDFRVFGYQLRGEDDCFALRRPFDLSDLVSDLAEFLDWHCLDKPSILGVSFGGAIALEFAAQFPDRVGAIAVQGAGAKFESGLLQQIAGLVLSRFPLPVNNAFVNQFFNLLFGARQKSGPLFEFVTRRCWQTDQSVMAHRFRLVEHFDMRDRLEQIQAPVLAIAGVKDLLVSERSLNLLADGIRRLRRYRLRGAGHLACLTHPQEVAETVSRFLVNSLGDSHVGRPLKSYRTS